MGKVSANAKCQFYCTATGPWTATLCLNCDNVYCQACNYSENGKMITKKKNGDPTFLCCKCNKNPKVLRNVERPDWQGSVQTVLAPPSPANHLEIRNKQESWIEGSSNSVLLGILRPTPEERPNSPPKKVSRNGSLTSSESNPRKGSGTNVFDRLTDPKRYGGTHKTRFFPEEEPFPDEGTLPPVYAAVNDNSAETREDVLRRLTNHKNYPARHRNRFNQDGTGKGLDGYREEDDRGKELDALNGQGVILREVDAPPPQYRPQSRTSTYFEQADAPEVFKRLSTAGPAHRFATTEYDVINHVRDQFTAKPNGTLQGTHQVGGLN